LPDNTGGIDKPPKGREIVYDEPALIALLLYKDSPRFDDRISALEWALWLGAEDYPLVYGGRIRVARLPSEGDDVPMRAFFEIESDNCVVIRTIETVE